jgi:hypothetical protein
MSKKGLLVLILMIGCSILLVSCATQPKPYAYDAPGFFSGILHGLIVPFTFVFSFFSDIRIYAFPNSGKFYDLGFLIGVALIFGGGGAVCSYKSDIKK